MVVRSWRGYGALASPEAYPTHLLEEVDPKLARLPGFLGLCLLRRQHPDEVEFLVLTLWESMEAIRAFAGPEPEKAVVEPAARATLLRYDSLVSHYEVVAARKGTRERNQ
jgi:heme-degrading monooxygenase HmoA